MTTETISGLKIEKNYYEKNQIIFQFRWLIAFIYLSGGGLLGFAIKNWNVKNLDNNSLVESFSATIVGAILGILIYSSAVMFFRNKYLVKLKNTENKLAELGATDPVEDLSKDQEFYTKLVQINLKYTDQYYLQTQEQADKSFRLSAFASVSGLLVLILGIYMMFDSSSDTRTSGFVTTTAGVLSEFIAAIFFYLYTTTIRKMSEYHKKLIITQNINLAMRIADKLNEKEVFNTLIDRLTADINKYLVDEKQ